MVVAKMCYGVEKGEGELNATNVAAVRCCADYFDMMEAFEEGNVVSRADAYLTGWPGRSPSSCCSCASSCSPGPRTRAL